MMAFHAIALGFDWRLILGIHHPLLPLKMKTSRTVTLLVGIDDGQMGGCSMP